MLFTPANFYSASTSASQFPVCARLLTLQGVIQLLASWLSQFKSALWSIHSGLGLLKVVSSALTVDHLGELSD